MKTMMILLALLICSACVTAYAEEPKNCSPNWCEYEQLKADSAAAKSDYTALNAVNTKINEALRTHAGTGAVYAFHLLLANNLIKLESWEEAWEEFEEAFVAAREEQRPNIAKASWNTAKTAADKYLKEGKKEEARKLYLWCKANKARIGDDMYAKVEAQITYGLSMSK